ncbi:uncharacterized protein LOC107266659 [Cephus cinctus]|uniref:Uncharacterized protein LOC107266659 n=1 Tax=Cephus cinctus TaxID=211228 RepID=A0AAJ7W087_CEPCN|nr:uncharacterized protein LOC107266659 [Cephus cinctus]XP_024939768.1 uncharacterized protein LOC107266659 [Cephus cinctus]
MKGYIGYLVLCIFLAKVQCKPQITKLFPVKELAAFHERTNEVNPLDKLLGKLRATYNFVFHKPEDTSNVEKILSRDPSDPDVEALKKIWANVAPTVANSSTKNKNADDRSYDVSEESKKNSLSTDEKASAVETSTSTASKDDWLDDIEAPKQLDQLELTADSDDDSSVESVTPHSTLHIPVTVGRHLLEWLGSLLGLTYGAYAKLALAIKNT